MSFFRVHRGGAVERIKSADDLSVASAAQARVQHALGGAIRRVGVNTDALIRTPREALRERDVVARGSQADSALRDGDIGLFGRIFADAQADLCRQGARSLELQMRAQGYTDADVLDHSRRLARQADADMGAGSGISELLTAYLYRVVGEPIPPQHFTDLFAIQGGLSLGLLQLQIVFWSMSGQAQMWDGSNGGQYAISGPGYRPMTLDIAHFLSEHTTSLLDDARQSAMGIAPPGGRDAWLRQSHVLAHNRIAFGIGTSSPEDLPVSGLREYPGVTLRSSGYASGSITGAQLYQLMAEAVTRPRIASSQVYDPDVLAITPEIERLAVSLFPSSGDSKTVMDVFRAAFPGIRIVVMWELTDLVASSTEAILAYPSSGDAAPMYLYNPAMILPSFSDGLVMKARALSSSAGVFCASPVGIYLTSITRS